ncbi:hypothetical protein EU637_23950 [Escherichia coli]|nr:hypothetical protein [Escherichia coli]EEY5882934.1 hypothetical protein [Escherichia coli]EFB2469013.1 hypothetical protein [Escherichia coli]EFC6618984.1 hypothetical protein [Escherichia coli]EFC6833354.1 hypothetical protein [Escherichia coli]
MRCESANYIGARSFMAAIMPDIKAATYRQCQNNGSCVNGMHSYKPHIPPRPSRSAGISVFNPVFRIFMKNYNMKQTCKPMEVYVIYILNF